jgi:hypothetical protein
MISPLGFLQVVPAVERELVTFSGWLIDPETQVHLDEERLALQ